MVPKIDSFRCFESIVGKGHNGQDLEADVDTPAGGLISSYEFGLKNARSSG